MKRYTRRALPTYRHRPGHTAHPERDPEGHLFGRPEPPARLLERDGWSENDDYLFAVDLFNDGYFWEAHVFWERLWAFPGTPPDVRRRLRGLIQIAAACLKRAQEEREGAKKLLRRARENLEGAAPLGVDADELEREAREFVEGRGSPPSITLASS